MVERTKKNMYTIWGLNLIVSSEKILFCFVHVVLLISLEIMRKKNYISRFILQGSNIIFNNILDIRCSLRKIKWHFMGIFGSERRGNAAMQRTDLYDYVSWRSMPLQSKEGLAVIQCCCSSEVLNLNISLNIKIRKKSCKNFLVPCNINNHQLQ